MARTVGTICSLYEKKLDWVRDTGNLIGSGAFALPDGLRPLIGEMLVIRVCHVIESALPEIYSRFAAGFAYADGSVPVVWSRMSSIKAAMAAIESRKAGPYLKWSSLSVIERNVKWIFDPSERAVIELASFGAFVDNLYVVRNHCGHGSSDTRRKFKNMLRQKLGYYSSIAPGAFAFSKKSYGDYVVVEYARSAKVMIRKICGT
jgi:hypothetical protein